jgi:cytochrome c-type biogenesis protein CcmH/NrfG
MTPSSSSAAALRQAFFSADEVASYWRPLTRASFVIDGQLSGGHAWWFHLVNVALHALNAALLFLVTRELFRSDGTGTTRFRSARSAVAVNPRSVRARYNLGVALLESGRAADARREWEEGLRLDPADAATLTQLGTFAAAGGHMQSAEAFYLRALERSECPPETHFNLARVYEHTGRPQDAIREYRAFLRAGRGAWGTGELVSRAEHRLDELSAAAAPARP